jgi:EmrB/QacA subfamily drug resistance transporter
MSKQQRMVLLVAILASFVAFLDGAIVNVALPAIQRQLGGGLASQQWIVDAYLLTLGSLILIAGSLSDLFGRKRILSIGLLGFGAASLLCAVAPTSTLLIIFRAVQGIAGALLVPSSLAMIISAFSGPAQGKAIGTWTAWTGVSFILGPLLGGLLVDEASWRWVFAINVFPIALTLFLLHGIDSGAPSRSKTSVDFVGTILCVLGLGGPVFGLIEQSHYGWSSPLIALPLIAGVLLFATFLVYESKAKHPMLPLSLFTIRNFSVGNIATTGVYAGLGTSTFLLVLFLQQVAGYSALSAGLALLPVTFLMLLLSARFGGLAGKYGPRFFMCAGPLVAGCGFLLMLRLQAKLNYWDQLFPAILLFGLGISMTVAPLTAAILGDIPTKQAGIASAVNNAVSRIAGLVAIAAVGAIVASQFSVVLGQRLDQLSVPRSVATAAEQSSLQLTPPAPYQHNIQFRAELSEASVSAFHRGVVVIAGLVVAGGIVSGIGIQNPKRKPVTVG